MTTSTPAQRAEHNHALVVSRGWHSVYLVHVAFAKTAARFGDEADMVNHWQRAMNANRQRAIFDELARATDYPATWYEAAAS